MVHHAPAAMWPGSGVVLFMLSVQVESANVASACVACVKPHVWGFHVSRFSCSLSARSPSVLIIVVVCFGVGCAGASAFVMRGRVASRVRMIIGVSSVNVFIFVGSCLFVVLF